MSLRKLPSFSIVSLSIWVFFLFFKKQDLDQDRQAEVAMEKEEALVGIEELSSETETTITQQQAIRKKSLEEKRETASTDQQMISSKAEQQTITKKTSIARKQSTTSKPEDTEQSPPPFAGMKLKKATRVQRESREETLPFVELKHHEFEISPQDEEVPIYLLHIFYKQFIYWLLKFKNVIV